MKSDGRFVFVFLQTLEQKVDRVGDSEKMGVDGRVFCTPV